MTTKEFAKILQDKLTSEYGVDLSVASNQQIYRSLALICRQMMSENHKKFQSKAIGTGSKQVYYLCMEFLMGRSLKMSLFNLGLNDVAQQALAAADINIDGIFEEEPDAGLGNGGLGRLAACYLDGIMIRTYEQKEVEDLANYGSIPIINGLTDFCHPCQVLADLMTIREKFAVLEGLKMCYIGDGNNMANSLIVGGLKTGMKVSIATPVDYRPDAEVMAFAEPNPNFFITDDPMKAAENADVVITDTWASMGQEAEKEVRMKAFQGYQVNDELLAAAKPDCMVQHCLPAYREQEITTKVFEEHANEIFEEAENRLHAQKAVMVTLITTSAFSAAFDGQQGRLISDKKPLFARKGGFMFFLLKC